MKRLRHWILPALTLLLIVTGAAIPYGTAAIQDSYIRQSSSIKTLDTVSLTLQQGAKFEEVLRLISSPCSLLDWEESETNLTAEEAEAAAKETIRLMEQDKLLYNTESLETGAVELIPYLAVSEDGAGTALVWLCTWEDGSCQLTLDDLTGKMVAFAYYGPETMADGLSVEEAMMATLDQWVSFCRSYYKIASFSGELTSRNEDAWQFELSFPTADGQRCALRLVNVLGDNIIFNM